MWVSSDPIDPEKKRLEQYKKFEERAKERRDEYQGKILERKTERHAEDAARILRQQENVLQEAHQKKEEQRLYGVWKKQKEEEHRMIEETKRRKEAEEAHLKKIKEEEEERHKHQKEYMKDLEEKAVLKRRQEILKERTTHEERAKTTAQEHFDRALIHVEYDEKTALEALAHETRETETKSKGDIAQARQRLITETHAQKMEVERKRKTEESKIKHGIGGLSLKTGLQQLERDTLQKVTTIDKHMNDQKKMLDQLERDRVQEIEKEYEKKKADILHNAAQERREAKNQYDQGVTTAERHTHEEEAADARQEERHKMDSKFSGKEPGE